MNLRTPSWRRLVLQTHHRPPPQASSHLSLRSLHLRVCQRRPTSVGEGEATPEAEARPAATVTARTGTTWAVPTGRMPAFPSPSSAKLTTKAASQVTGAHGTMKRRKVPSASGWTMGRRCGSRCTRSTSRRRRSRARSGARSGRSRS